MSNTLGNFWGIQAGFVEQLSTPTTFNLFIGRDGTTINLSWPAQVGATSYTVYVGLDQDMLVPILYGLTSPSATIENLIADMQYFVQVTALYTTRRSVASPVTFTGGNPVLTFDSAGDGYVDLSWSAVPGANYYNVYQGTTAGGENFANPMQVFTTGGTVTGLIDAITYYFVVTAVVGAQESPPSNEVSGMPFIVAPSGVTAQACSGDIELTWDAVTNAAGYNVYLGTTPGGESPTPVLTGVTGTSVTVHGLTNGTEYYLTIKTVSHSGGLSAASSEVNATPELLGSASALTATTQPTTSSIALAWTAGSAASAYNILRGITSGGETLYASGITGTTYSDTAPVVGVLYYYEVQATNTCGQVAAISNEASAELSQYVAAVLADSPLSYITGTEVSGEAFINLGSLGALANWANTGAATGGATLLSDGYPANSIGFGGGPDTGGGNFLQVLNGTLGGLQTSAFTLEYWLSTGGSGPDLGWTALNQGATGQNTTNTAGLSSGANGSATTVTFGHFRIGGASEYYSTEGSANPGQRIFVSMSSDGSFFVNGVNQLASSESQSYSATPNGMWFGQTWDGGDFDWQYLDAAAQHIAVYGAVVPTSHRTARYGIGIGGGNGFTEAQNLTDLSRVSLSNQNRSITRNSTSSGSFGVAKSLYFIPDTPTYFEGVYTTSGGSTTDSFSSGFCQLYYSEQSHPLGGNDANSYGYTSSGNLYISGAGAVSVPTLAQGDITSWWLDSNGNGWAGKNGVPASGNPQTGTSPMFTFTPGSGPFFAAIALYDAGDVGTLNLNTTNLVFPSQGRFAPMLP